MQLHNPGYVFALRPVVEAEVRKMSSYVDKYMNARFKRA